MEIRHADLQIEVEDAEDGGVLLTIIDSARLSLSLPRKTAKELLDAIDACMKTGERQTTDSVDVWRTADDLPLFGMHVGIDGASWTCGAVRSWDVDGLADGLEARKGPSGLALGRAGAVQRPFLIAQTARAVRMTSAAMGCTAGARQTAMTAISQMIGPPRGPFPESRISAPFRWAAPRLARQRRPAVAGRSLSTRANGRRSTGTMVSANMESAGWRRANFFPFSRRCATTSSGRWPRPVGCP